MHPLELGKKYTKIASLYEKDVKDSAYGLLQAKKAISFSAMSGTV